MAAAFVHQLGRGASQGRHSTQNSDTAGGTGITPLRSYKFNDIFPTNVVYQIDLSYDSTDTIEEYTVEFQVQYWEDLGSDQTATAVV